VRNTSRRVIISSLIQIRLTLLNVNSGGVIAHFRSDFAVVKLLEVLACFEDLLSIALLLVQRVTIERQFRQLSAVLNTINTFKFIDPVVA